MSEDELDPAAGLLVLCFWFFFLSSLFAFVFSSA